MTVLTVQAQTLFAELTERVLAREASRSVANLTGFFTSKSIAGTRYWYFKASLPGTGQHEYYLGPESRALQRLIAAHKTGRAENEAEARDIVRLCAMLRAAGANLVDAGTARVLQAMSDAGVFRLGGVLVGTQAYVVLGNMLGVHWDRAARTQDIDIAASNSIALVLPQLPADVPSIMASLQMGFLPVPPLDPRMPSTSFKVRGKELRVDFLTPAFGRRRTRPVVIARLNTAATPLEMLDYLIEGAVDTVAVNGGATPLRVPNAAQFALHKLAVADRRTVSAQTKAAKDRDQAFELLDFLRAERPGDVDLALALARERFTSTYKRILKASQRLAYFAKEEWAGTPLGR